MKKILSLLLTLAAVSSISTVSANDIKVLIDGKNIEFDVPPMIIENRTMVPLRKIFEEFGAIVEYEPTERMITAIKDETEIVLFVDRNDMYVDQQEITLDVPAVIVESRTLVPVRAISEAFACDVKWQGETSSVVITSPGTNASADVALTIDFSKDTSGEKKEVHGNIRYNFEQDVLSAMLEDTDGSLKNMFVNNTEAFVNTVGNAWNETVKEILTNKLVNGEDNKAELTEDLNSLIAKKINEYELHANQNYTWESCVIAGKNAIVLKMADIDTMLVSTYIAIVYDEANGFSYYMLEKSMSNMYMLCTRQGEQHINLGFAENNKEAFVNAVAERM